MNLRNLITQYESDKVKLQDLEVKLYTAESEAQKLNRSVELANRKVRCLLNSSDLFSYLPHRSSLSPENFIALSFLAVVSINPPYAICCLNHLISVRTSVITLLNCQILCPECSSKKK